METPTEIIKTKKSIEPYNKFIDNVAKDLIEQKELRDEEPEEEYVENEDMKKDLKPIKTKTSVKQSKEDSYGKFVDKIGKDMLEQNKKRKQKNISKVDNKIEKIPSKKGEKELLNNPYEKLVGNISMDLINQKKERNEVSNNKYIETPSKVIKTDNELYNKFVDNVAKDLIEQKQLRDEEPEEEEYMETPT